MTAARPSEPWLPLAGVGLAAGVLSGLLGVGGGIVMVPLLVAALHYDQHTAHATSLAAIAAIAAAGGAAFAVAGEIDVAAGLAMGAGGIAGSTVGAHIMHRLSVANLKLAFAVIVVVAGIRMVTAGDVAVHGDPLETTATILVGAAIGLFAGFGAGVAGIGGGVVMVPAMVFAMGLGQHTAEGTSLLAILLTALAGTRVNVRNRRVSLRSAAVVGIAGAAAAPAAAWVAVNIDAALLARIFGVFVLLAGGQMLVRALLFRRRPLGG